MTVPRTMRHLGPKPRMRQTRHAARLALGQLNRLGTASPSAPRPGPCPRPRTGRCRGQPATSHGLRRPPQGRFAVLRTGLRPPLTRPPRPWAGDTGRLRRMRQAAWPRRWLIPSEYPRHQVSSPFQDMAQSNMPSLSAGPTTHHQQVESAHGESEQRPPTLHRHRMPALRLLCLPDSGLTVALGSTCPRLWRRKDANASAKTVGTNLYSCGGALLWDATVRSRRTESSVRGVPGPEKYARWLEPEWKSHHPTSSRRRAA